MQDKSIENKFPGGESEGKMIAIVAHKAPQFALDVLFKGKTWDEVFLTDWRRTKSWQPGWEYILK